VKALAIGSANVRRMLRDRSNIFFVFIFPLALILLIGAQFGGGFTPLVGVHLSDDGEISGQIVERLESVSGISTLDYPDRERLIQAVERGQLSAAVFIPSGLDQTASAGEQVIVEFTSRADGFGWELASVVGSAVADVMGPVGAAQFASNETGVDFDRAFASARTLAGSMPELTVSVRSLGEAVFPPTMGRFDLGASQQLVLFMFITALTGSSALILTRQLGISKRMLATPTRIPTILLGESLGRFGTAMVQGLYIVVVTRVVFGVNWGDPLGLVAVLLVFSAVGAGAAMLMGSLFSNDQQASGVAIILSLGLAAMGGAMMAVEFFPPTMQTVALFTPHAWAISAFAELIRHDGTLVDILPQLGVLAGIAALLLLLATWRFRLAITRA
jgi:ABC-2 type transport system permease protein